MPKVTVWETPRAGSLANLVQKQRPLPPLSAGHLRVQVHAVGLNFADIFALTGLYSATPEGAFIPGLEFAGTVIDTGTDSGNIDSAFQVGDQVGVSKFAGRPGLLWRPATIVAITEKKWPVVYRINWGTTDRYVTPFCTCYA